ncbi:MAG: hypothetical protein V8R14_08890 [Clostridia bacterium]
MLIVLVFIQLIVLHHICLQLYSLDGVRRTVDYICGAVELAVIGYFFCKNRLYEKDGSKKEF